MIEPVTATIAASPAADGAATPSLMAPAPSTPSSEAAKDTPPPPPASKPAPLSLNVVRADDGVFVYTLSNPVTGAVVAVIPRRDVSPGGGRGVALDELA